MLLSQSVRRVRDEDRGAALVAVLGLMTVSLLTTSLIATSIVTSTAYTTTARAGVQSQAAAEAGIAVARAGLRTPGSCAAEGNSYESTTAPEFEATIWVPSGASWVRGCPPGTATQVRILSTGFAQADGVVGAVGRDETSIEVILSSASVPTQIEATGPAVYAYNSAGFGGGGRLVSVDGSSPDILIREGNVNCTGGASGQADIVVNNGSLTVSAGCSISGNVWASGRVTLPGGPNVGGNVVGSGLTISGGSKVGGNVWVTSDIDLSGGVEIGGNATAASMKFNNGGTVRGNAQVTGPVTFTGGGPLIQGNLTAASLTTGNGGKVAKNGWIYGATTVNWGAEITGNLTTRSFSKPGGSNSDFVKGTLTVVPGGPTASPYANNPAAPATPLVPNWYDFNYDLTDWTGFASATISSSGTCSYTQVKQAVASFAGQPGVINALGCVNGISIGGSDKVNMTADLAIFSKRYDLGGGGGFAATSTQRLWLITPDDGANGLPAPDCVLGDNSFGISGGFTFSNSLRVMMYTPCRVMLGSSTSFNGQVFAGKAGIDGGARLGYVAVGLPGVNLDTGVVAATPSTEADRTIVSFRNVTEGN